MQRPILDVLNAVCAAQKGDYSSPSARPDGSTGHRKISDPFTLRVAPRLKARRHHRSVGFRIPGTTTGLGSHLPAGSSCKHRPSPRGTNTGCRGYSNGKNPGSLFVWQLRHNAQRMLSDVSPTTDSIGPHRDLTHTLNTQQLLPPTLTTPPLPPLTHPLPYGLTATVASVITALTYIYPCLSLPIPAYNSCSPPQ